jgi:hypothetical protein
MITKAEATTTSTAARSRLGRRSIGAALAVVITCAALLFGSGAAGATAYSEYGGRGFTISYCGNSHTSRTFDYKTWVYAEFSGQVVAKRTQVLDAAGWHDHGWVSRYGSGMWGTTVYPTTGYTARVFTQYAWLRSDGWHYSAWNESAYQTVWGTVNQPNCAI